MKKIYFILTFVVAVFLLNSCAPTPEEAAAYNEKIIAEQKVIVDKIIALDEVLNNFYDNKIDEAYNAALTQTNTSITNLENMEKFDRSSEYKDAALVLFKEYKTILDNEYLERVRNSKIPMEEYTQANLDEATNLATESSDKITKAETVFEEAQNAFSKKYNIELKTDVVK
jgi:hypothetical protein